MSSIIYQVWTKRRAVLSKLTASEESTAEIERLHDKGGLHQEGRRGPGGGNGVGQFALV